VATLTEPHQTVDASSSSCEPCQENSLVWPTPQHNSYISTATGCSDETASLFKTRVSVEVGVLNKNPESVFICNVDVEPCPGHIIELNELKFTTNAIGSLQCPANATATKLNELPPPPSSEVTREPAEVVDVKTTPDVLDRISQDLDYLLNRSPSPTRSRKNVNGAKLVTNNNCVSSPTKTTSKNIIKPNL
jgi:hypothetical protein